MDAYMESNDRVSELVRRIQGVWLKTREQIVALGRIWDLLDENLQVYHEKLFTVLQVKLDVAVAAVTNLVEPERDVLQELNDVSFSLNKRKKARYASVEKIFKNIVDDLELWYKQFDHSWLLVTLIPDAKIDYKLLADKSNCTHATVDTVRRIREAIHWPPSPGTVLSSVLQSPEFLTEDGVLLPGTSCQFRKTRQGDQHTIVEATNYPPLTDKQETLSDLCDLARLLCQCELETIHILSCLGVIKANDQIQIIYHLPYETKPTSLRALLSWQPPSLNLRLHLAKCMASAVLSVHTASLVHKNIRPETLIVFPGSSEPAPPAFLVGFECFRPSAAGTNKVGDLSWERNLYRHPKRQGIFPEDRYVMQHDIYSLGVCLLEIGLWDCFVRQDESTGVTCPSSALQIAHLLGMKDSLQAAREVKRILTDKATTELPRSMGEKYTAVTRSCLSCLDRGEHNIFRDELELEEEEGSGIVIGLAFIEKVMMQIEQICL